MRLSEVMQVAWIWDDYISYHPEGHADFKEIRADPGRRDFVFL
jgi:hypothetical protein